MRKKSLKFVTYCRRFMYFTCAKWNWAGLIFVNYALCLRNSAVKSSWAVSGTYVSGHKITRLNKSIIMFTKPTIGSHPSPAESDPYSRPTFSKVDRTIILW